MSTGPIHNFSDLSDAEVLRLPRELVLAQARWAVEENNRRILESEKIELRQIFTGIRCSIAKQLDMAERKWGKIKGRDVLAAFDNCRDEALRARIMFEWFNFPNDRLLPQRVKEASTYIEEVIEDGNELAHPSQKRGIRTADFVAMYRRNSRTDFSPEYAGRMLNRLRTLRRNVYVGNFKEWRPSARSQA